MTLDASQERALALLDQEANVFLTGGAGTGKTYLVHQWVKRSPKTIALTATTGVAALLLGGQTLHRFSGIQVATRPELANGIVKQWWRKAVANKWVMERLRLARFAGSLVIDEVSMLRSDQMDLVDLVLQGLRGVDKPFGGIQVVCTGDFFQLPPVVQPQEVRKYADLRNPYAFQSKSWNSSAMKQMTLEVNHRQSDGLWLQVLERMRRGHVSPEHSEVIASRVDADIKGSIKPVLLFPLRRSVHIENSRALQALPGSTTVFKPEYKGSNGWCEALKRDLPIDDPLVLKPGAQVMMLNNDSDDRWVNGSTGVVRRILDDHLVVDLSDGQRVEVTKHTWSKTEHRLDEDGEIVEDVLASCTAYPVRLAWASTVHKIQGASLDCVEVDLTNCFGHGMAYVALSRVRSLEGLTLRSWNPNVVSADPMVKDFDEGCPC